MHSGGYWGWAAMTNGHSGSPRSTNLSNFNQRSSNAPKKVRKYLTHLECFYPDASDFPHHVRQIHLLIRQASVFAKTLKNKTNKTIPSNADKISNFPRCFEDNKTILLSCVHFFSRTSLPMNLHSSVHVGLSWDGQCNTYASCQAKLSWPQVNFPSKSTSQAAKSRGVRWLFEI